MKYLNKFMLFESQKDDADYIKMMLIDFEDSGEYVVRLMDYERYVTFVIECLVSKSDIKNYLLLDELYNRINQILDVLPNYKLLSFSIIVFGASHYFKGEIDQPNVISTVLDDLITMKLRGTNLKSFLLSVFEPGMIQWQEDMVLSKSSLNFTDFKGRREKCYDFMSEDPRDDFSISFDESELSEHVRLPISDFRISFIKK